MQNKTYSYLALGDSYTIGEGINFKENFPTQTISNLLTARIRIENFKIIAKTGWTTDELENAIKMAESNNELDDHYDLVTLLIGVNNQYRNRPLSNYELEFEKLLTKAIRFTGNNKYVIVLSIPDWGVTPFAIDRDRKHIAREIDLYNKWNRELSEKHKTSYLDITTSTRESAHKPGFIADDGLHPSGQEYSRWAQRLADLIKEIIRKG